LPKQTNHMQSNNTVEVLCSKLVLFGALGDLVLRKIMPALYQLEKAQLLDDKMTILAVGRRSFSNDEYLTYVAEHLEIYAPSEGLDNQLCKKLLTRVTYNELDYTEARSYANIQFNSQEQALPTVHYLATPPSLYGDICHNLFDCGAINDSSRIVLEKPIGYDLQSSQVINDQVGRFFTEEQIFRIDHYLGKETVQNLLALRFANPIFAGLWDHNSIEYIEITAAESVGIEGRSYFDETGQLRDMLQNHLLQLLCIVAMDPPTSLCAESIRNEKVQVLKALKPMTKASVMSDFVSAQYGEGNIASKGVPSYTDEISARADSETETFVAIKVEIANWRWSGTPFYLRTGKRLASKSTEIVIHFKPDAHFVFNSDQQDHRSNRLIIRLQPQESISLTVITKKQGIEKGLRLRRKSLHLDFCGTESTDRVPDAYERLLLEIIKGDQSLFVRRDEVELAWQWCDRLIESSKSCNQTLHKYDAGSYGPIVARKLIQRHGHEWHEDV